MNIRPKRARLSEGESRQMGNATCMYRRKEDGSIEMSVFDSDDSIDIEWYDSPAHVPELPIPGAPSPPVDEEREAILEMAENLRVAIDKRWSTKRIKEAIHSTGFINLPE